MPRLHDDPEPKPAMTYLQYVCRRLMGPPAKPGGSYGESYWRCPFHGGLCFHTKPHKPPYPDKWNCFACGRWGDEFDLVRELTPLETNGARMELLDEWRQEYELKCRAQAVVSPSSFRGSGQGRTVHEVYAGLSFVETEMLAGAFALAKKHRVDLFALADFCFRAS